MTSTEEQLKKQMEVSEWIDHNLSIRYDFQAEESRWPLTCYDMVIEHHTSIVTLCHSKLFGSAFALLRVQFEALVRGLWLQYSANEREIENFKLDKGVPGFGKMIAGVECSRKINYGTLSYLKKQQWTMFNSFTHTGPEALVRRMGSETTGYDNYTDEDVVKCLRYAGLIALFSSAELALMTENENLVQEVLKLIHAYCNN